MTDLFLSWSDFRMDSKDLLPHFGILLWTTKDGGGDFTLCDDILPLFDISLLTTTGGVRDKFPS